MAQRTTEQGRIVKGFFQLDDLDVARDVPGPGQAISIQAEDGDLRVRFDGVDPTASVGQIIAENTTCYFAGDLSRVRIIEVVANCKANIHVYGESVN